MRHVLLGAERADAILSNRTFIPVFELSDENLAKMVEVIVKVQPVLMDGYAEALDFIARYIKTTGRVDVRPTALMSSAQTLPGPSRKLAVFQVVARHLHREECHHLASPGDVQCDVERQRRLTRRCPRTDYHLLARIEAADLVV